MLIQIGSYSAIVEEFKGINNQWQWVACHFLMSDNYGLDIESKQYKHKSSAIRYAKQQLQIKYDVNLARIKL